MSLPTSPSLITRCYLDMGGYRLSFTCSKNFVLLLCLELLGADVYHNIQVVNLRCLADLLRWELWADLLTNVGLLLHEI